jgi:hypothetical protein
MKIQLQGTKYFLRIKDFHIKIFKMIPKLIEINGIKKLKSILKVSSG